MNERKALTNESKGRELRKRKREREKNTAQSIHFQ
jgi:hypothetical protein